MSDDKRNSIRIELTTDQKRQIKEALGEDVSALELPAQELEQRIAPTGTGTNEVVGWSWGNTH